MIRVSTIFIAICMVLIAASLGLVLYAMAGFGISESAIVALTALTFLILYNAVSMRLRDRSDVGAQIADLSRGTAELARQVAEFGRRLATVEQRTTALDAKSQERVQTALSEISELGALVKQLAVSIAAHDDLLAATPRPVPAPSNAQQGPRPTATDIEWVDAPVLPQPAARAPQSGPHIAPDKSQSPPPNGQQIMAAVKRAIDTNRIDIFLQPLVTLPQRKVRFYEAVSRIRDNDDQLIAAKDFIATAAETAGLMGQIDRMVLLRCIQVLRRLMVRNKDVGVFCNISAATLGSPEAFAQRLDFLEANRALAPPSCLNSNRRRSAISGRWRARTSPPWRSAAIASRSTMSATCGSNRANWRIAESGSSRCPLICCSTRNRCRHPTSTQPICPTCWGVSASTLSRSGSRANAPWSTCWITTSVLARGSCSPRRGHCAPKASRRQTAQPTRLNRIRRSPIRPALTTQKIETARMTGKAALVSRSGRIAGPN